MHRYGFSLQRFAVHANEAAFCVFSAKQRPARRDRLPLRNEHDLGDVGSAGKAERDHHGVPRLLHFNANAARRR